MATTSTKGTSRRQFLTAAAAVAVAAIPLPKIHDAYAGGEFMGVVGKHELHPEHDYLLIDLGPAPRRMNWKDARAWAASVGGDLPNRRDLNMLRANRRVGQFADAAHWSNEQFAGNDDYAWYQLFDYGTQHFDLKDNELLARAVRRVPLQ